MSNENPGFLNEFDAFVYQRSPAIGTNCLNNADIKATESSIKRKIADSFEGPFKEKKRSSSPQRIFDWEFIRMREEIANYKMEVVQLESRLRKQGEMRVESEISAAKEIKRLEMERGTDRAELKQLRYVVERLRQNLTEQEERLSESSKSAESEKRNAEAKMNAAQAEVVKLKDVLREVETTKESLLHQVSSLKLDAAKVAEELEEEKLKVAKMEYAVRTKARDALYVQKDLEKRAINAERLVQELTRENDFLSESLKEAKSTAAWVLKEAELENDLKKARSEVKALREAVQGKLLLEECNHGLQERISNLEGLLKNSADMEAAKDELSQKLKEWQVFAVTVCNAAGMTRDGNEMMEGNESDISLTAVRKAMNRMQFKEAELTSELLEAQSRLKELQSTQTQISFGSDTLKSQVNALTKEKSDLVSVLHMTRRKLQLVSQERDTYRQLLDSMEQEMTLSGSMFHSAVSSKSPQKHSANVIGGIKGNNKLEELERLIEKYQKNTELLEAELAEERKQKKAVEEVTAGLSLGKYSEEDVASRVKEEVEGERSRLEKELEVVCKEKETAREEAERLKARIDQLEGEMEHRALKGDFNVANTKVLHFKMNPISIATEKYADELEACRSECERLRERVKVLEEKQLVLRAHRQSGEALGLITSISEDELLPVGDTSEVTKVVEQRLQAQGSKEMQDLREQLRLSKMLPERLKEAFKIKIKDFRDACYNIFGYKLKLLGQGRCSISSLYAESPDDHLLFEISPSGLPSLLETPFSDTLGDLISVHLMHQHSIPAFVSAVTLELVNRQTIA